MDRGSVHSKTATCILYEVDVVEMLMLLALLRHSDNMVKPFQSRMNDCYKYIIIRLARVTVVTMILRSNPYLTSATDDGAMTSNRDGLENPRLL